ncbi:MAG: hypothetical protein EOP82_01650 [Variovorax sp.]|nr:MAG: hypothetical protein EOP82_01650 [Variovorax sp.]
MTGTFLRNGLLGLAVALLLSCGGGGGGGVAGAGAGAAGTVGAPPAGGMGSLLEGSNAGGPGDGQGGSAATGTSTASAGSNGDGSGVGSGGTGVSTADAAGIGAVDGAGSIFVNGLRYNTDAVVVSIEDTPALQLGMSAKVAGPVDAEFTSGVARRIESAADVRGTVSSVSPAQGSFVILGTTVTTDEATVWGDSTGLAAIAPGATLQIWGLPAAPGVLLATRVEQRGPSEPILSGTVQNLDATARTFTLGGILVDYSAATSSTSPDGRPLANGTLVRVRANAELRGRLPATLVQWWYPVPIMASSTPLQLAGVVTDYAGLSALRVLGVTVDTSSAQITGGPSSSIGNGVKVQVAGHLVSGVLKATKIKIRHVPGTGGSASFNLAGNIGSFSSASSFKVRGQPIDAGGPGVVFVNGTAANLGNGVRVGVEGARVVDGVLTANRVTFN